MKLLLTILLSVTLCNVEAQVLYEFESSMTQDFLSYISYSFSKDGTYRHYSRSCSGGIWCTGNYYLISYFIIIKDCEIVPNTLERNGFYIDSFEKKLLAETTRSGGLGVITPKYLNAGDGYLINKTYYRFIGYQYSTNIKAYPISLKF